MDIEIEEYKESEDGVDYDGDSEDFHDMEEAFEPEPALLNRDIRKIPVTKLQLKTKDQFIIFFRDTMKEYTPSPREFTKEFGQNVLALRKRLLKLSEVRWVYYIPKYRELKVERIWRQFRDQVGVRKYFPNYTEIGFPSRAYFFNVMNTIFPGSIERMIQEVQKIHQAV